MISIREARRKALVDARDAFFSELVIQATALEGALAACGAAMDGEHDLHDLLWTTRAYATQTHPWLAAPLHRFSQAMHPTLRDYAALSNRLNGEPVMWPDAQTAYIFCRAYTDFHPGVSHLTRVVLCVQHTYRAWRKARNVDRNSGPANGIPR